MNRFLPLSLFVFALLAEYSWAQSSLESKFIEAAIKLYNPDVRYDGSYRQISYPLGDVPSDIGVCSDVVVRAYRAIGIDIQKLVHEDMESDLAAYPKIWGLSRPDPNIDHRRVPNLRTFFERHGKSLSVSNNPNDYKPGDIVTWNLKQAGSLPHIGIVTNRHSEDERRPLIMHNIGYGQVLEDMLFEYRITGHYRYGIDREPEE